MFTIPFDSSPNQNFRSVVPVNGTNMPFEFRASWNSEAKYWSMSVSNSITGQRYVTNIPILAGVYPAADLLGDWQFLRIGSATCVKINPDSTDENPGINGLGTDFIVVWTDNVF